MGLDHLFLICTTVWKFEIFSSLSLSQPYQQASAGLCEEDQQVSSELASGEFAFQLNGGCGEIMVIARW